MAVVLATALAAAVVTVTAPPAAAEPPANDDRAHAEEIAIGGAPVNTDTLEAILEPDEPRPCGQINYTVWFAVTPAADTTLTVRTLSADPLMDTVLAVHTAGEALVCNDDHSGRRSKVTFPATADVTYYLQVGHYGGTPLPGDPGPGPLQVQVVEQPTPTNDDVTTPEVISGETGETAVDTTLATHAAGDPSQPTASSHTLWYEWQATSDGVVAFDTRSDRPEHPDTFLVAFPDDDGPTTTETALAFNDDVDGANRGSRITFDVAAGTTYRILAGTRSGHDPFRLGWAEFDPVATATDLEATSPSAGLVDLAVVVTRDDGEVPSGSVAISDGDDLVATLPLTAAGTAVRRLRYRTAGTHDYSAAFQPDGPLEQPSSSPDVSVSVAAPTRPGNDDFADAAALTGAGGTVTDIALAGATAEPGEALDPAVDGASVWYRWRAPVSDTFTFTVASDDPAVDSVVGALRGSQLDDLTVLRASREPAGPGSQITFSAIGGRDYYVQVDAVVAGTVSLTWSRPGGSDTTTTLAATSPSPYAVRLISHTTGASAGTVIFLRDGAVLGQVSTTDGDAQLHPTFQRPGPGTFTAEFYPDDLSFRPSVSESRVLDVDAPVAPANDEFVNAVPLGGPSASVLGTTFGATADPGTPPTALPSAADTTVWYRWVAPADGSYTFLVTRTMAGVDTVMRAFEGTTLATLRTLDENDDDTSESTSRVGISAVKGRIYHLAVDAYSLSGMGPFRLTWGGFTPTETSTTALTATANGSTVTLTATVGPAGDHPAGFVEFFSGTTSRGRAWVTAAGGTATRTLTNVPTGRRTFRAVFVPDDYRYARSEATRTVTVPKAASRTTLTAPSRLGVGARPVVSTVVRVGNANATGSVRFTLNGRALRTVALRGGRASLQLPALRAGTARVVATYLGTTRAARSSAARSIAVRR